MTVSGQDAWWVQKVGRAFLLVQMVEFLLLHSHHTQDLLMCVVSWLDQMAGAPHHSNSNSSSLHNHHQTLFCLLQYSLHSCLLSSACSTCLETALALHQLHL